MELSKQKIHCKFGARTAFPQEPSLNPDRKLRGTKLRSLQIGLFIDAGWTAERHNRFQAKRQWSYCAHIVEQIGIRCKMSICEQSRTHTSEKRLFHSSRVHGPGPAGSPGLKVTPSSRARERGPHGKNWPLAAVILDHAGMAAVEGTTDQMWFDRSSCRPTNSPRSTLGLPSSPTSRCGRKHCDGSQRSRWRKATGPARNKPLRAEDLTLP